MHCDDRLKQRIAANLAAFDPIENKVEDARHAAVAITVTDAAFGADLPGLRQFDAWQPDAALILTRRSEKLRNHAGQWALPGGRLDPGEAPLQTALRELREEVDLHLPAANVLGVLDDFVTRSGFVMSPVVLWGGPRLHPRPDPNEVASVHRIPLAEFMREDAPLLDPVPTSRHPMLRMPVGDSYIAAPTAALIYQFREVCLLGRHNTRVAHYEQPTFAWK